MDLQKLKQQIQAKGSLHELFAVELWHVRQKQPNLTIDEAEEIVLKRWQKRKGFDPVVITTPEFNKMISTLI
jgi:hypothetical protein